ncbi:cytochrome c biogenesis heme-transporting ATPase CcmA [Arsukibacterium indicum]|uniref:Cytochrome c biogenesis heme-transporting ATPase CcmA n=1 Tax=Arsukibacterium indicum TaxID=2848612 RepID=A0ABS6MG82_9GAMM|nr:cytochrome c biogenesis heme-transporting ATPase CcmA [Arsukibacterium indicum]MBV2127827.1 cytochrome c biogenesis heme-transporting ATPase CcmA [Arsukibacterium indicum]
MNITQPPATDTAAPGLLLLRGEGLSCIRQDRVLFSQLSLQLHSGQLLQILGKNGAGKSSLLRILAGLASPDDGQVFYQAKPLAQSLPAYCGNLCYIGHQSGVHEQLTALENLRFWRAASGLNNADDWALLAQLGLAGLEDVPCRMLSAGQQRRVSLARLWLTPAKIWILDEPFTALDQSAIVLLQQQMLDHLNQGGAIILTSHQNLTLQFQSLVQLELAYRW